MIHVKGLTKRYGEIEALGQVEFHVAQGEIVGLLGHNGAGKSTLVNVATGALNPQRGTMEVEGKTVKEILVNLLKKHPKFFRNRPRGGF